MEMLRPCEWHGRDPPGKMPLLLGRKQDPDIGLEKSVLAIPPLLAVGAVHHYLIQQGLRTMSYFFSMFFITFSDHLRR